MAPRSPKVSPTRSCVRPRWCNPIWARRRSSAVDLESGHQVMLRVQNIDVFHGDAQALDGVSLEIDEGAIVAIVGANGAGKTSLIRTIAGMHRPARGRILYRGADIGGWPS